MSKASCTMPHWCWVHLRWPPRVFAAGAGNFVLSAAWLEAFEYTILDSRYCILFNIISYYVRAYPIVMFSPYCVCQAVSSNNCSTCSLCHQAWATAAHAFGPLPDQHSALLWSSGRGGPGARVTYSRSHDIFPLSLDLTKKKC